MPGKRWLALTTSLSLWLTPLLAQANDRHFAYSYESAVLAPGMREIEVWNTFRARRPRYFSAFDHRLEFEVGLVDRLQTAFYLNFSGVTNEDAFGKRSSRFEYRGISSEWKLKLLDPVADPLGLALYGEGELGTDFGEIEAKVILDKRAGPLLFASNVIAAREWSFASSHTTAETELEITAAASYFFTPSIALGLEGRALGEISDGDLEYATTYAGPVLAYAQQSWWAVITPAWQLPALKRQDPRLPFAVRDQELFNLRLLFSFHL